MDKIITYRSPYLEKIPIKREILAILGSAFASVDPVNVVKNNVCYTDSLLEVKNVSIPLEKDTRIMVWSLGKAAQSMAAGLKEDTGGCHQNRSGDHKTLLTRARKPAFP